ncbi:hypothetical protein [Modestobacter sp. VKM Ac-2984]|uniref:hypothetical protein n=1 Tax=Modestobacter sp. VKM Ac-2984 TaxID=3004138 RepID=UPI0022AA5BB8|nr:hypothetical protein [Modestobacter sp. VKM Ac-2984]MCZ2815228.1 hypothetical protein [Modestobacter sp. VKM Ac-2984]
MEWYELTVNLVTGLAWPAVVGGIAWGFRSKIRELLGRTGRLTLPGGLEWHQAEIADKERELLAEVEESAPVLIVRGSNDQLPPLLSDRTHIDGQHGDPRPDHPSPSKGNGQRARQYEGSATGRSGLVASQREAFEDVVQRAAEWGAARGRAGLGVEGTKVEWGQDGSPRLDIPRVTDRPIAGSAESMGVVLSGFAHVNDRENRGATRDEARDIARRAGMDPRGTAGYYSMEPPLLVSGEDGGRWITQAGRERLRRLRDR